MINTCFYLLFPLVLTRPLCARAVAHESESNILCRMLVIDTMLSDFTSTEELACVPVVDGCETDDVIPLELPFPIPHDDNDIFVNITNPLYEEGVIRLQAASEYALVAVKDLHQQVRRLAHKTPKTVAMIRVSSQDVSPTILKSQLEDFLFAPDTNFIAQFDRCSMGQLKFQAVGVWDVVVGKALAAFAGRGDLVRSAQIQIKEDLQLGLITELADRILFCLPPGLGSWVASAPMNHWRATFNDRWCTSLSATMHELGHTLGLPHSNEEGVKYGDSTGYMAKSFRSSTWPLRCFNGRQHYMLGWHTERTRHVNTTATEEIHLAAFVDYAKTLPSEPVLVIVGDEDLFLLYNRKKSFNSGTGEMADQVTITNSSKTGTELLAGLDVGDRFEYEEDVIVEVCRVVSGNEDTPDTMVVRVGSQESVYSLCEENIFAPKVEPTPSPSLEPTANPSSLPSAQPTLPTTEPTTAEHKEAVEEHLDRVEKFLALFRWIMLWAK